MASLFSGAFDHVRTTVGYFALGPATNVARQLILSVLHKITIGQLVIEEKGVTTVCGTTNLAVGSHPLPATVVHVKNDAFWVRVALFADMVCLSLQHWAQLIESGFRRELYARRVRLS